jgi:hypothetical protein
MRVMQRGVAPLRRLLAIRNFLSEPLELTVVEANVQAAIEARDERFLETTRHLVYEHPRSPYLALLRTADCTYADLESAVRQKGLEATLTMLRDAGVHVTAEEWKGRTPIVRPGLELAVGPSDFNNPSAGGGVASGGSSGSSGAPTRSTSFGHAALTEYAADFLLLLGAHGAAGAPTAMWMPCPPGSGLLATLAWAKSGNPPVRWFSQTKPAGSLGARLTARFMGLATALTAGVRLPTPVHTELEDAARVAEWLGRQTGTRVVKGFTSSIVRAARAAAELGIDLTGTVAVIGGEPVDRRRTEFLQSCGIRVAGIYVATETGLIGLGCANADAVDDYHVCLHRLAAIPAGGEADASVQLLLTSLSANAGKVLLNADIADEGMLERRACGCALGALGLDVHLVSVHSRRTQTSEGMSVPVAQLLDVVQEELAPLSATQDDFQLWETHDEAGLSRVVLAVSPRLDIDPDLLESRILERLAARSAGAKLAADVWRQAGTIKVVSATPKVSERGKLPLRISVP